MKSLLKFLDDGIELYMGYIMLIVMVVLAAAQVFSRHVLQSSLTWTEELCRYLYMWMCLITTSYATKENGQMRLGVMELIFSKKAKVVDVFNQIGNLIWLAFSLFMVFIGMSLVSRSMMSGETSPALGFPKYIVYIAEPLGFGLMAVRIIQIMLRRLMQLKKGICGA